jgi:hypothetical protein
MYFYFYATVVRLLPLGFFVFLGGYVLCVMLSYDHAVLMYVFHVHCMLDV